MASVALVAFVMLSMSITISMSCALERLPYVPASASASTKVVDHLAIIFLL